MMNNKVFFYYCLITRFASTFTVASDSISFFDQYSKVNNIVGHFPDVSEENTENHPFLTETDSVKKRELCPYCKSKLSPEKEAQYLTEAFFADLHLHVNSTEFNSYTFRAKVAGLSTRLQNITKRVQRLKPANDQLLIMFGFTSYLFETMQICEGNMRAAVSVNDSVYRLFFAASENRIIVMGMLDSHGIPNISIDGYPELVTRLVQRTQDIENELRNLRIVSPGMHGYIFHHLKRAKEIITLLQEFT